MLDCLMLRRLLWSTLLLLTSVACISAAQDACIYRSGAIVHSVVVVKHTIRVITSVPHDTVFSVNTDITVTVDNAPTSLDFLTTYFSRSTAVETISGLVVPFDELWSPF